ncbi:hypothetical protein [Candidatus Phytoplasma ziziphi]|uniref:hypothetical protein n=1 Tax=Ziziphus jujuba witches'-broom phytoplasma TaxID=135727 RepID=UPI001EDEE089|nr:hypothetical protein [Candidatus Phytoplasma ziziphi]
MAIITKRPAKMAILTSIFLMEKSKPFIKMASLPGKQKEFLKLKKPTKDLNLKVFFKERNIKC